MLNTGCVYLDFPEDKDIKKFIVGAPDDDQQTPAGNAGGTSGEGGRSPLLPTMMTRGGIMGDKLRIDAPGSNGAEKKENTSVVMILENIDEENGQDEENTT